MITPRYDLSLDFLRRFHPGRRWLLTAIDPDTRSIETRTFSEAVVPGLMKWLETQGATRNLYFSVGEPLADFSKKAERTDMARVWWFHVDVDPRAGEDVASEQARSLALLKNPPGGLPPPTVIVFSGGGHQAFWALSQPIEIDGKEELAEDTKLYNLAIEVLLGADNVHDISRIMRLPGSVNRPDSKKRAKGRVEALAEVVEWHEDRLYDLSQFQKAPKVQKGNTSGFSSGAVTISGNIRRFSTVDELPAGVDDTTKLIIVQGIDPNEPTRFNSRSEWLFRVLCVMCRANMSNDDMYAIITDPAFGISASVLDKGSGAEKYALRQIERAREEAIDPDLRKYNETYAVIRNLGNKCLVVEEIWDEGLKRHRIGKMSFEHFRNGHMHITKALGATSTGTPISKPMGHWWLSHANRRQYDTMVFAPGREVPGSYNLWRGFACESRPGSCQLFLTHLLENVCRGSVDHYDYLIKWMARAVQQPDTPGYSAIVLRGGMGTGKGFTAKTFGSLFGRHYMQVTDPKHLVGSFNAHLRDCVVLFGDEAFYAGDKKHESILKTLITEEQITVEAKGVDAESALNCVHLIMASNERWVVPTAVDDRRFFVLDVAPSHKEDHAYFHSIQNELDNGGREALLHSLMSLDLKGFNVRKVPKTTALQEQKVHSFGGMEEWWFTKLREGRILPQHSKWETEIPSMDLLNDFLSYSRSFNVARRGNNTGLTQAIQRFCPGLPDPEARNTPIEIVDLAGNKRMVSNPYFWSFPQLDRCRTLWDENFGGPYKWPEVKEPARQLRLEGAGEGGGGGDAPF